MGLRINTNVQSLSAQRSLSNSTREQDNVLTKLSSGSRINKAADDAAGLAISENLKAQIRGYNQANRNANDGISLVQTAEGGLTEISSILIRLREISVQAASDTIGDTERTFTDLEFQALSQEVTRIAQSTKFNGKDLLNGEGDDLDFQIGIYANPDHNRLTYSPADTNATASEIGIDGLGVTTKEDAQDNLSRIDEAITKISGSRASLGALQNRMQSSINNIEVTTENLSAANSRIRDTDVAAASSELARLNVLKAAGTSVLAQSNTTTAGALKLIG